MLATGVAYPAQQRLSDLQQLGEWLFLGGGVALRLMFVLPVPVAV